MHLLHQNISKTLILQLLHLLHPLWPPCFESTEVELMDIDWDDLEGIDENLLPEIGITFVNDETVTVIVEENP